MRLAFDRLFGSSAEASDAADERDWRQHKWVIEPTRLGFFARVEELWRYRRIAWFFAVQRIKDRYEGTTLGPFWLFARPLMPINRPSASNSGPPELPGLIEASVWRQSAYSRIVPAGY